MWPSQEFLWQQWPQQPMGAVPLYGSAATNPTPQETDPGEWAMKAAQWAQQRQMQEQTFQHVPHWQQPMVDSQLPQYHFPPGYIQQTASVVPPLDPGYLQQPAPPMQPPAPPQLLMEGLPPQHLPAAPEEEQHNVHFEAPGLGAGRGQGGLDDGRRFGGEERQRGFRPRFGGRGHEPGGVGFRPRGGGYQQPEFRHHAPRGGPRAGGPPRHAGLGYQPMKKGPDWGRRHFSPEVSEGSLETDMHPPSPTEQYFQNEDGSGRNIGGQLDFNQRGGYSHHEFSGAGGRRDVGLPYKEGKDYMSRGEPFSEVVVKEEREEVFEEQRNEGDSERQDYIGELEQLGERMAARDREQDEWRRKQEQSYAIPSSRAPYSTPTRAETESPKSEPFQVASSSITGVTTAPSSLSRTPAVIPGFGDFGKEAPPEPDKQAPVAPPKEEPQPGSNQTTQMMESLGKIVSQLQTLQGLTSSLQLLQNLPKAASGQQEGRASSRTGGESERVTAESAQRERENELSEETKRKVAALLANDSDSDGEQAVAAPIDRVSVATRPKDVPRTQEPTAAGVGKEPSPPAREFDGTFNVKPQVYGTYAASQEQYEADYRGPQEEGRERGGEYRYRDYEYPPAAREHERERPPGYDYDYPPRPPPGTRDYPYPPSRERPLPPPRRPVSPSEMAFESRDYGHGSRPAYEGPDRDYKGGPPPPPESRYERGYPPPPPEPFRRAPPPMEEDRYYASEREKGKASIASQLETIDYSHGGGLALQSVDYHHGQSGTASRREEPGYRDRPPRVDDYPPGPLSRYDSYPPHPGYGPMRAYPQAYPEGFPPAYPPYGGAPAGFLPPGFDPASLFAAYTGQTGETKRKALPVWLREALEKMERDKQKKLEKTSKEGSGRADGEGGSRPTWREELEMEEEEKEKPERDWEEPAGRMKRSYRFRSKTPNESDSDEGEGHSPPKRRKKRREGSLGTEDEEEKQLGLVMRIRKMLTEILLEVTNREIQKVAMEAVEEARDPKRAFSGKSQQKIQSDVLAGLNMYASDSEEEEEEKGDDRRASKSKAKSRSPKPTTYGPVLDPIAIAAAFMDSVGKPKEPEVDTEREKSKERGRESSGIKEKRKDKERPSSRKDSSSERSEKKSSDESSRSRGESKSLGREKEKGKDKDKESSKKRASSSSSSVKKEKDKERTSGSSKSSSGSSFKHSSSSTSSKSKKESPPPSPGTSGKRKSSSSGSAKAQSRSRSPSKTSSSSSGVKIPKSYSSSKKPSSSSDSSSKKSSFSSDRTVQSSSPLESSRKRSRHHSRSPSPAKGKGGRIVRERIVEERRSTKSRSRSRSPSPGGDNYSKWSTGNFSSPRASTSSSSQAPAKIFPRIGGFSKRPFWGN